MQSCSSPNWAEQRLADPALARAAKLFPMAEILKAAAIQLNTGADVDQNIDTAERLVRQAAAEGARLVVLPEKFNVLGIHDDYWRHAQTASGPLIELLGKIAAETQIDLIAGSFVERIEGQDRLGNSSFHIGPDGQIKAHYSKIHMFDVEVGGETYRESTSQQGGNELTLTEVAGQKLGMTVCYDLRFPELYRIYALRGATILAVPAAFTFPTGEAHWESLLRARAIENQAFVIAANQFGVSAAGQRSYGNSMIVGPWGEVLAHAGDQGEAVITADLDFGWLAKVRAKLPALANRVPGAYLWPS